MHPIWSLDRNDWVALGEHQEGEQLLGAHGPAVINSRAILHRSTPVYNIEIHGEHVYQVGELGLLVHNAADDCVHAADWILWGPRGVLIKYGDEISGADAVILKGWKLTFPERSWFGHTDEKIIDGLSDVFKQVQKLIIEGRLLPCSQCQIPRRIWTILAVVKRS